MAIFFVPYTNNLIIFRQFSSILHKPIKVVKRGLRCYLMKPKNLNFPGRACPPDLPRWARPLHKEMLPSSCYYPTWWRKQATWLPFCLETAACISQESHHTWWGLVSAKLVLHSGRLCVRSRPALFQGGVIHQLFIHASYRGPILGPSCRCVTCKT